MSGDSGLNETIVFYSSEMTMAKAIVLKHKGIELDYKLLKALKETEQRNKTPFDWQRIDNSVLYNYNWSLVWRKDLLLNQQLQKQKTGRNTRMGLR